MPRFFLPRTLALLAVGIVLSACSSEEPSGDETATGSVPESAAGHMSYGAGYALAGSVREQLGEDFDSDGFRAGITDALDEREMQVSDENLTAARDEIVARREASAAEEAESAMAESRQLLEENAERDAVTVTDSGLQYEVLESGDGASPGPDDTVVAHYTGRLANGNVFDSSEERGEPAEFPLNRVIEGWQEALQLMQVGDRWRLWIPPELGYGDRGAGDAIPPNAALVFDVELLEVTN